MIKIRYLFLYYREYMGLKRRRRRKKRHRYTYTNKAREKEKKKKIEHYTTVRKTKFIQKKKPKRKRFELKKNEQQIMHKEMNTNIKLQIINRNVS